MGWGNTENEESWGGGGADTHRDFIKSGLRVESAWLQLPTAPGQAQTSTTSPYLKHHLGMQNPG